MSNADSLAAAAAVSIDWDGIVNGSALVPDYALSSTSGWPVSFADWPMIVVDNPGTPVTLDATQIGPGRPDHHRRRDAPPRTSPGPAWC